MTKSVSVYIPYGHTYLTPLLNTMPELRRKGISLTVANKSIKTEGKLSTLFDQLEQNIYIIIVATFLFIKI